MAPPERKDKYCETGHAITQRCNVYNILFLSCIYIAMINLWYKVGGTIQES